jgi:hypothetical protein
MTFPAGVSPARLFVASTACSKPTRGNPCVAAPVFLGNLFLELVWRPNAAVGGQKLRTNYGRTRIR